MYFGVADRKDEKGFQCKESVMLSQSLRLKNSLMFQKAFRFGKPFFFGNVGCRVLFHSGTGRKIGFITAKKMFHLAVERNRARRLLAEAISPLLSSFPEDVYIVVFFRGRPENMELSCVKSDMDGLVKVINAQEKQKRTL